MKAAHTHMWESYTLDGSDWRCRICGALGKEVKRFNRKTGKEEWVIRKVAR